MTIGNFIREAGRNSPEVRLDPVSGDLYLVGKSIPENATALYSPIVKWIEEYVVKPADETNLHLDLIYFNTASSIWIARIIKILSTIDDREKLLVIHLYFHIEEFEEMEEQDLADAISPVTEVLASAGVSIGVRVYGKDDSGKVLREKLILL